MSIPVQKMCDECGRTYRTVSPRNTCPDCLIRPHRKNDQEKTNNIPEEKGIAMPQEIDERKCEDCGAPYKPTGCTQKRCPECIKKHDYEYNKAYRMKNKNGKAASLATVLTAISVKKTAEIPLPADDTLILRMIVAAGLITEEKINKAREIVRILKS
jgi:hypothetical protein